MCSMLKLPMALLTNNSCGKSMLNPARPISGGYSKTQLSGYCGGVCFRGELRDGTWPHPVVHRDGALWAGPPPSSYGCGGILQLDLQLLGRARLSQTEGKMEFHQAQTHTLMSLSVCHPHQFVNEFFWFFFCHNALWLVRLHVLSSSLGSLWTLCVHHLRRLPPLLHHLHLLQSARDQRADFRGHRPWLRGHCLQSASYAGGRGHASRLAHQRKGTHGGIPPCGQEPEWPPYCLGGPKVVSRHNTANYTHPTDNQSKTNSIWQ